MSVYYNENDPNAAEWLRQLIELGQLPDGFVDERSIIGVHPTELAPYDQHHFFAGVGVWAYALRQAGWPDDRPVVTGSCPCQPYSSAGKKKGADDERDLWWAMFWHLCQLCPPTIFGEQVSSKAALRWWDTVSADLEGQGYAATAFDLCAASVGAPHIRQRLFWVANANGSGRKRQNTSQSKKWNNQAEPTGRGSGISLANAEYPQWGEDSKKHDGQRENAGRNKTSGRSESCGEDELLAHPNQSQRWDRRLQRGGRLLQSQADSPTRQLADAEGSKLQGDWAKSGGGQSRPARAGGRNFWSDCSWLQCSDGKARPIKPGLAPLVNGAPSDLVSGSHSSPQTEKTNEARIMRLKGYGNAVVAPLAIEFIRACMEVFDGA